jgi:hypothetical protein
VRRLDRGYMYLAAADLADTSGWTEDLADVELADILRSTLREEYAGSSDEEMAGALDNVLDAMSPAEAYSFGSALNQIGKSASRLASDPAFIQIARTAAPIAGGALGTLIGGPVGTALGSKLGSLAANALPVPSAPRIPSAPTAPPAAAARVPSAVAAASPVIPVPAAPPPVIPAPPIIPAPAGEQPVASAPVPSAAPTPPDFPLAPGPASSLAGGSAAAAQGLVLTQQPEVLRGLLATALGQHGRQRISGIPVAQLLAMLSQVFGQAAADADELMYLGQQADATESVVLDDVRAGPARSLYGDLLGADNLELAEAAPGWGGLD